MTSDNAIDAWVQAVRGRPAETPELAPDAPVEAGVPEAAAVTEVNRHEIALIRRLFEARSEKLALDQPAPFNEQRWDAFLQQMRKVELPQESDASEPVAQAEPEAEIEPAAMPDQPEAPVKATAPATGIQTAGRARAANRSVYAIAAAIGVLAIGLSVTAYYLQMQNPGEELGEIIMRGTEQTVRIQSADPKAQADRIVIILNDYHIKARRIENADGTLLQAKLPPAATEARNRLTSMGIEIPEHGRLNILLAKPDNQR